MLPFAFFAELVLLSKGLELAISNWEEWSSKLLIATILSQQTVIKKVSKNEGSWVVFILFSSI